MIPFKFPAGWPIRLPTVPKRGWLSRFAGLLACAIIVGCAPVKPRPAAVAGLPAQAQREAQLASLSAWSFNGRVAVNQGNAGGTARIEWRQQGDDFDIKLAAPITRQSWRLRRVGSQVRLEGLEGGSREGPDPEALLLETIGWRIPVDALAAWVRGVRSAGPSEISFDAQGLPATLQQEGWAVEYRGWFPGQPALPAKVFAKQGQASVRLVVEAWDPR